MTPGVPALAANDLDGAGILRLVTSGASAWQLDASGARATATIQLPPGGSAAPLVVRVAGMPIFSFEATLSEGAHVEVVANDETLATATAGSSMREIPLDGVVDEIHFLASTGAQSAQIVLSLVGPETLTAPMLLDVQPTLVRCALPAVYATLRSLVPLDTNATTVTLGSDVLIGGLSQSREGGFYITKILAHLPASSTLGETRVRITAADITGNVWQVLDRALGGLQPGADVSPRGWAYDLRPTLRLDAPACSSWNIQRYQLVVDGIDVTRSVRKIAGALTYEMPEEIAFGEPHTFTYTMQIRYGPEITRTGTFRGGFAVEEFDLGPGLVTATTAGGFVALAMPLGGASFAGETGARIDGALVPLPQGAHARAVYAPLAIACETAAEITVCDPIGGDAPGYGPAAQAGAVLELRAKGAEPVILRGVGQLAATAQRMG